MIERVRSVRKIALVALALVFAMLLAMFASSMLAQADPIGSDGKKSGTGGGHGYASRDIWVLGDADAKNLADVKAKFYNDNEIGTPQKSGSKLNLVGTGVSYNNTGIPGHNTDTDDTPGHKLGETDQSQNLSDYLEDKLVNAIKDCEKRALDVHATCEHPRVVAIGEMQFTGSSGKNWSVSQNSGWITHSIADVFSTGLNTTVDVQGNTIKISDPLGGGGSIHSESLKYSNATAKKAGNDTHNFGVIVVGEFQYQQKGWYPTWQQHNRADLATANKISSHQLAPCAAYYYMTATGTDGYVRGYTTKTVKYQTPYGKLYDAVQTGKTWTSSPRNPDSSKTYGPFKGDWEHDEAKLKELQEARDVACNETQNMKIVFNYGVSGSSPDASVTDSGESTSKPSDAGTTITVLGKDDFNKKFAQGGIYKVTKSKKDATLTAKTTDVMTFYRLSDWYEFTGWHDCKKDDTITPAMMGVKEGATDGFGKNWSTWNGNKCGHIGEDEPKTAPAGTVIDQRDDFLHQSRSADDGFYAGSFDSTKNVDGTASGDWHEIKGQDGTRIYNQILDKPEEVNVSIPGEGTREISGLFNRGYVTKYNCGGKQFDAKDFGNNGDMASQSDCTAVAWNFQNVDLGWATDRDGNGKDTGNVRITWKAGGYDAWKYGMPLNGEAVDTLNGQLHPVGNHYQSIVAIAYQDFLNINCNKRDFDAFVNQVSTDAVNAGVPENLTLRANVITDTKYNGRANTGVITKELADSLRWVGLPQIVPRVFGDSWIIIRADGASTDRFITGLSAKQVTGQDSPTIYGVVDGARKSVSWDKYINQMVSSPINYWSAYDASRDPVYSKECPFDCTDDRASTNDTAKNNVMADHNNPTQDDAEHGRTGVLATDNTSNGSTSDASGLSVNTANMVFFRNNEWNKFVVDLYTPKSGTNNAGDISYDGGPVSAGKNGPAKSTIITRDPDGTPWFAADASKTVLTHLQPMTGAYAGKDIFTNKPDETSVGFGQQLSIPTETTTTGINQTSVQLYGQINSFRIKSAWATENGKPLKFQMKWEYNATDHVSVPSTISFKGTGTTTGNIPGDVYREDTIATAVDGKCLGQQNTLDHTPDTTDLNHDNSGSGTDDNDDTKFDTEKLTGSGAARGWFGVTFVRATAE